MRFRTGSRGSIGADDYLPKPLLQLRGVLPGPKVRSQLRSIGRRRRLLALRGVLDLLSHTALPQRPLYNLSTYAAGVRTGDLHAEPRPHPHADADLGKIWASHYEVDNKTARCLHEQAAGKPRKLPTSHSSRPYGSATSRYELDQHGWRRGMPWPRRHMRLFVVGYQPLRATCLPRPGSVGYRRIRADPRPPRGPITARWMHSDQPSAR